MIDKPLFIFHEREKAEIERKLKQGELVQLEPIWSFLDYSKIVYQMPILTFNKDHEEKLVEQYKALFK